MHPETVGNGGIDIEGFRGDPATLVARHRFEGPHVMKAIGEFDHDHSEVLHHRQKHFSDVLRLGFRPRFAVDSTEFGHPINQFGDFFTKLIDQSLLVDGGVFNDIVHDRRHDPAHVHAHIR